MRKIFLYMTMSLDGYLAGPSGELDWMLHAHDEELNADIASLMLTSDTGLIGFPTAKDMVPYWAGVPNRSDASQDEQNLAKVINKVHVIMLTNQPEQVNFANAEQLLIKSDQDLVDAVARLKQLPGKDIGVPGGVRTAQKFVRLGLADEYVFMVHPVAISKGQPLFIEKTSLETVSAKAYASGVVRLRLRPRLPERPAGKN